MNGEERREGRRVFVCFLGIGSHTKDPGYEVLRYEHPDGRTYETRFAQRAIIEAAGAASFDSIVLFATTTSREKHLELLKAELLEIGCREDAIHVKEDVRDAQTSEEQWKWFELLLLCIQDGDEVVFDFTHGFRSVPIVFSTAIAYLQRVRSFRLAHAFYGYMDTKAKCDSPAEQQSKDTKPKPEGPSPGRIIDMAPFFRINDWTDAVSRLVHSADAGRLAELAETADEAGSFAELRDPELVRALTELTAAIKDVRVNDVGAAAGTALKIVKARRERCKGADRQLLQMVIEKFGELGRHVETDGYTQEYFEVQYALVDMLLEHELFMQAFTAMREAVASLGMVGVRGKYRRKSRLGSDGRRHRKRFGELFAAMCAIERNDWKWEVQPEQVGDGQMRDFAHLLPFWNALEEAGHGQRLQEVMPKVGRLRNAYDHGWTAVGKKSDLGNAAEVGREALSVLREVTPDLIGIGARLSNE
ncbi:MAG: TIGR02221 family CRISPR-associated protein [Deltaproteobacteria bacterium]|nr:MAG: TIGR02221 family CRISPR-associated protein [Deltaproteobacteria bacterium]